MPAILGNLKVINISSGGVLSIGDVGLISPKTTAKTYAGSGSFNTGDFPQTYNVISSTNTNDNDVLDENVISAF
ncbi:spore germination protein PA [Tumebacillus sp. BK434]|uniref:Spore gernimation protein GerPA n=1 Tax=Tumebacillus avium TaxID=1903704 RepID=A0A1Y0IM95_9BACL|nr:MULTISPECIES: spore germination protein [Tumebacillus]ARU61627.1 spore gernimation protein GerPA [Tumebacillus avium]TCP55667.1 spore germination protein PA [Tumebacillus sp. BK434]